LLRALGVRHEADSAVTTQCRRKTHAVRISASISGFSYCTFLKSKFPDGLSSTTAAPLSETLDELTDRLWRQMAERAKAGSGHQAANTKQRLSCPRRRIIFRDLQRPARPGPARHALAARLVSHESQAFP